MQDRRSNSIDPQEYLKVPLHRERFRFETVGIEESIKRFIGLILITRPGNFQFDPEFGCRIWDQEFQYIKKGRFKEDVQKAVQEALELHENRLKGIKVDITVKGFDENSSEKRLVEIWVRGTIKASGRLFENNYEIDWDRARKHTSS